MNDLATIWVLCRLNQDQTNRKAKCVTARLFGIEVK